MTLPDEARAAEAVFQWEQAARIYEDALTHLAGADPREQAPLLVRLGHCYRNMAEARASWRALMRAIAIYREAGDAPQMAEATLEALQIWAPPERQRALAEAAYEFLGPGETRAHAALLLHMDRLDEGQAISERRGYRDMVAGVARWRSWHLLDEGRVDEIVEMSELAHYAYAAAGEHDRATGMLRSAGYALLAAGRLDDGVDLARRAWDYARERRMRFSEQLAGLDIAGVLFARAQFDDCLALLEDIPGELDFRKDLFRAWIAEQRGDSERAVALLPSPERAGGAGGALSQLHSGRAGVLWRAGKERAARAELGAWVEAARIDGRLMDDAPAALEPLLAQDDDALLRAIIESPSNRPHECYSTLQGRGLDRVRGAVSMRLGRLDDAERHFRAGADWAVQQRCTLDEEHCRRGRADIATMRTAPPPAR
jgi:tetratricopeptide (TPR) repeat protein